MKINKQGLKYHPKPIFIPDINIAHIDDKIKYDQHYTSITNMMSRNGLRGRFWYQKAYDQY